jgi:hypothetical protein
MKGTLDGGRAGLVRPDMQEAGARRQRQVIRSHPLSLGTRPSPTVPVRAGPVPRQPNLGRSRTQSDDTVANLKIISK